MTTEIGLLLFGLFFLLLVLEVPIAFSLGIASTTVIALYEPGKLIAVPQLMFAALDSFPLLAVPFFMVVGLLLGRSGISRRLVRLARLLVGRTRGGLAIVTVIVSIFFAGISGSGPADVAALGLILIPALVEAGYEKGFAAALMSAGGGIGIIVPPSIALVIYGVVARTSIPRLFVAGILPGVLVGLSLMILVRFKAPVAGDTAAGGSTWREVARALLDALPGLLIPVLILGGIYGGAFTPTEAAAVAVVYAFLVDLVLYRELKWPQLFRAFSDAAALAAQVTMIVACAILFKWVLEYWRVAEAVTASLLRLTSDRVVILLLINAIVLAAGCFLDAISIFYVLVPILLPVARSIGVDPVHFGVILTVNLAIGQITPPVGINLFVASSLSGTPMSRLSRAVLPFVATELAALLVVTFVPPLSLWLPELMEGLR